jgi:hypothetical protein
MAPRSRSAALLEPPYGFRFPRAFAHAQTGPRVVSGKARLGASMRMEPREDVPQGHLQFVLISFRHRDVLRSIIAKCEHVPDLGRAHVLGEIRGREDSGNFGPRSQLRTQLQYTWYLAYLRARFLAFRTQPRGRRRGRCICARTETRLDHPGTRTQFANEMHLRRNYTSGEPRRVDSRCRCRR